MRTDHRCDCTIDAAAQAEHGGFESALLQIIARAEDQRAEEFLGLRLEAFLEAGRLGLRDIDDRKVFGESGRCASSAPSAPCASELPSKMS
jgi:hypothetical protein